LNVVGRDCGDRENQQLEIGVTGVARIARPQQQRRWAHPLTGVVAGDLYEREYRRRSPTPVTMSAVSTGAG
jgi:hypothetical protein